MHLTFSSATIEELPIIVEIYNSTIASRMVTADIEPVSVESRKEWFYRHHSQRPLWVVKNDTGIIIGWVSYESFYGRPAYNYTAEISIYLDENFRGNGFGKMILQHSIASAKALGIHSLLAFIFLHNTPSIRLFHSAGFSDWGTLPNVAVLDGIERTLIIAGLRIQ